MNLLSAAILPLRLHHPDGSTPVIVGEGALSSVLPELEDWLARRTAFLVTTPRVHALHGDRLEVLCRAAARWVILEVEEGEGAKNVSTAERLWNEMLDAGGKRDSRVIALRGGGGGEDRRRGARPDREGGAPAAQLRPHAGPRHRVGLRLLRAAPRRGGGVRHPLRAPPGPLARTGPRGGRARPSSDPPSGAAAAAGALRRGADG